MDRVIGGYFELELRRGEHYHKNALCINTARNCFEYILLSRKYKKIYIPFFTCEVMLQPLHKHHIEYEFYSINFDLELQDIKSLQEDEAILYTNYFGLKQSYIEKLVSIYHTQLIVDNSQAFYASRFSDIDTFYSPRKFFGVPDGAYLYTDCLLDCDFLRDRSHDRMTHLLQRIEEGAEAGYHSFKIDDESLDNKPIQKMSRLTQRLLCNIDYDKIKEKRLKNYAVLDNLLHKQNLLHLKLSVGDVPMVYPFYCENLHMKKYLIENKVFVATYWPNIFDWCNISDVEYTLCQHLLPLPIDQRYNEDDMEEIFKLMKG